MHASWLKSESLVDFTNVLLNLSEFLYIRVTAMCKYFCSRRDFLFQSGGGISGLALAYLLNQDGLLAFAGDACTRASGRRQPVRW